MDFFSAENFFGAALELADFAGGEEGDPAAPGEPEDAWAPKWLSAGTRDLLSFSKPCDPSQAIDANSFSSQACSPNLSRYKLTHFQYFP